MSDIPPTQAQVCEPRPLGLPAENQPSRILGYILFGAGVLAGDYVWRWAHTYVQRVKH
jgi:hypothetical protein